MLNNKKSKKDIAGQILKTIVTYGGLFSVYIIFRLGGNIDSLDGFGKVVLLLNIVVTVGLAITLNFYFFSTGNSKVKANYPVVIGLLVLMIFFFEFVYLNN